MNTMNEREKQLQADIDGFWQDVERGWDIEPRAFFEKEARAMGFDGPLAMAAHHMWKRELKNRESAPSPAPLPTTEPCTERHESGSVCVLPGNHGGRHRDCDNMRWPAFQPPEQDVWRALGEVQVVIDEIPRAIVECGVVGNRAEVMRRWASVLRDIDTSLASPAPLRVQPEPAFVDEDDNAPIPEGAGDAWQAPLRRPVPFKPVLTTDDYYSLLRILEVLPIADPFLTNLQAKVSDDERQRHGNQASHLSGPEFVREIERIEALIRARIVAPLRVQEPSEKSAAWLLDIAVRAIEKKGVGPDDSVSIGFWRDNPSGGLGHFCAEVRTSLDEMRRLLGAPSVPPERETADTRCDQYLALLQEAQGKETALRADRDTLRARLEPEA